MARERLSQRGCQNPQRVIRDACRLADSGIENKHIQSIAHDGAHLFGEQRSAVRSSQIRRDRVCASAFRLDLGDERFRFLRGAAIVNQDVCPGPSKQVPLPSRDQCRVTPRLPVLFCFEA